MLTLQKELNTLFQKDTYVSLELNELYKKDTYLTLESNAPRVKWTFPKRYL